MTNSLFKLIGVAVGMLGATQVFADSPNSRSGELGVVFPVLATPLSGASVGTAVDVSQTSDNMSIVDATGKFAGRYVGYLGNAILNVNGIAVAGTLEPIGNELHAPDATLMKWARNYNNVYPTADCSGPPIVSGLNGEAGSGLRPGLRPANFLPTASNEVIAYIGKAGPATPMAYQSSSTFATGTAVCKATSGIIPGWTLEAIVRITTLYPEPLRLR